MKKPDSNVISRNNVKNEKFAREKSYKFSASKININDQNFNINDRCGTQISIYNSRNQYKTTNNTIKPSIVTRKICKTYQNNQKKRETS